MFKFLNGTSSEVLFLCRFLGGRSLWDLKVYSELLEQEISHETM